MVVDGALDVENKDAGSVVAAFGALGAENNGDGFVDAVLDGAPNEANNEVDFSAEEVALANGLGGVPVGVGRIKLTVEKEECGLKVSLRRVLNLR